jgi:hypothetical protein
MAEDFARSGDFQPRQYDRREWMTERYFMRRQSPNGIGAAAKIALVMGSLDVIAV